MSSLNSRLQLALLNRKKGRNLLEKGFTLVELMVVIVIVGILSAVALPGFLSQATKAKGTEAKSEISAIIKNGSAEFQLGGRTGVADLISTETCEGLGGKADWVEDTNEFKFNYDCSMGVAGEADENVLTVTAIGSGQDSGLEGKQIQQTADLSTGVVTLVKEKTCQVFGGTNKGTEATGAITACAK